MSEEHISGHIVESLVLLWSPSRIGLEKKERNPGDVQAAARHAHSLLVLQLGTVNTPVVNWTRDQLSLASKLRKNDCVGSNSNQRALRGIFLLSRKARRNSF